MHCAINYLNAQLFVGVSYLYHKIFCLLAGIVVGKRTDCFNDGIAREVGERFYWQEINEYACKQLYGTNNLTCEHCKREAFSIELRGVNENSYAPSE